MEIVKPTSVLGPATASLSFHIGTHYNLPEGGYKGEILLTATSVRVSDEYGTFRSPGNCVDHGFLSTDF